METIHKPTSHEKQKPNPIQHNEKMAQTYPWSIKTRADLAKNSSKLESQRVETTTATKGRKDESNENLWQMERVS